SPLGTFDSFPLDDFVLWSSSLVSLPQKPSSLLSASIRRTSVRRDSADGRSDELLPARRSDVRDDLDDQGSGNFAETVQKLKALKPNMLIEALGSGSVEQSAVQHNNIEP
ncbi:Lipoyl synthase, mitochondrial, partial [Linum perenne]